MVVPPSKLLADVRSCVARYTALHYEILAPRDTRDPQELLKRGKYLGHYHALSFIHYELSEAMESIVFYREHPSSVNQPFNVWMGVLEQFNTSMLETVAMLRDITWKLYQDMLGEEEYPPEDYEREVADHAATNERSTALWREVNRLLNEVMAAGAG